MIKAQMRSDKLAASLSMVCVIHCFFAPSLIIFSYSFLSLSLESELVHYLILCTAVPISLLALSLGFKNHQTYSLNHPQHIPKSYQNHITMIKKTIKTL